LVSELTSIKPAAAAAAAAEATRASRHLGASFIRAAGKRRTASSSSQYCSAVALGCVSSLNRTRETRSANGADAERPF